MTQYKLAPIEPENKMLDAAMLADYKGGAIISRDTITTAYKAMLAECQDVESEPYKVLHTMQRQAMCTHMDGWICGRCKLIKTPVYTTPQPDRVAELEAKLAKVEADKARLVKALNGSQETLIFINQTGSLSGDSIMLKLAVSMMGFSYHENKKLLAEMEAQ